MNIAHFFKRSADRAADQPALAVGATVLYNHKQLAERAARLAGFLRARGRPGDHIAIAMANQRQYLEIMAACWWAGMAVVPMNAKLHRNDFAYMFDHSGARMAFADSDLAETIAPLVDEIPTLDRVLVVDSKEYRDLQFFDAMELAEVDADDLAWLFYTSGTTGKPKGAMITHRNIRAMAYAYFIDIDQIAPGDAILHAAPMSHGSGIYIIPHAAVGACQIVPESAGFQPAEIVELISHHPGTTMFAAPTMVKRLTDHVVKNAADTEQLKTIVYGGAPMYLADLQAAHNAFGYKFAQLYGQGESPMTITALNKQAHADINHPRYLERLASAGTAQSVVEVRVANEQGAALEAGEIGEIQCRGDSVVPGYWRNPEATGTTMGSGWLKTGDLGSFDQDGFLTLKDRSKDVIISGGSNIYPREIEDVLLTHPSVREVAVVGLGDPEWGERVVACVVRSDDVSNDILDQHCLEHIARFKRPKDYVFLPALPKNNYGKILKTKLREQLDPST